MPNADILVFACVKNKIKNEQETLTHGVLKDANHVMDALIKFRGGRRQTDVGL